MPIVDTPPREPSDPRPPHSGPGQQRIVGHTRQDWERLQLIAKNGGDPSDAFLAPDPLISRDNPIGRLMRGLDPDGEDGDEQ